MPGARFCRFPPSAAAARIGSDGGHPYPPAPGEPVPAVPPSASLPMGPPPLRGLWMAPITARAASRSRRLPRIMRPRVSSERNGGEWIPGSDRQKRGGAAGSRASGEYLKRILKKSPRGRRRYPEAEPNSSSWGACSRRGRSAASDWPRRSRSCRSGSNPRGSRRRRRGVRRATSSGFRCGHCSRSAC